MRAAPIRHGHRERRRRERAQGIVEFALVGGLFLVLIISVINAGLFLYGRNAVDHAADVGVEALAALGNCDNTTKCPGQNADTLAISRMDSAGLTTTPLITVSEIDIWKVTEASGGTLSQDTSDCSGACEDRYTATGTLLNPLGSGLAPWYPDQRNVTTTPDFAELVITFSYKFGSVQFNNLTSTSYFRLEPQV